MDKSDSKQQNKRALSATALPQGYTNAVKSMYETRLFILPQRIVRYPEQDQSTSPGRSS